MYQNLNEILGYPSTLHSSFHKVTITSGLLRHIFEIYPLHITFLYYYTVSTFKT